MTAILKYTAILLLAITAFAQDTAESVTIKKRGNWLDRPARCSFTELYYCLDCAIPVAFCGQSGKDWKQIAVLPSNYNPVELLGGAGVFAVNGLAGWTSPTSNRGDWSIVNGALHHAPGVDDSRLAIPINVSLKGAYLLQVVVAATNYDGLIANVGADCSSDCSGRLPAGTTLYDLNASSDSGQTVFELSAFNDLDVTIASVKLWSNPPALFDAGLGQSNIVDGAMAMKLGASVGVNNIAFGTGALASASSHTDSNIAVGTVALAKATGNDNVAVGPFSCASVVTGSGNVCLGQFSDPGADTSNTTTIGSPFTTAARVYGVQQVAGGFVDEVEGGCLTLADLAVDAADAKLVSSVSYDFTAADVGGWIDVTAGTGWTLGRYTIMSAGGPPNNIVLDRSPAAAGTTGGTIILNRGRAVFHAGATDDTFRVCGKKTSVYGWQAVW